MGVREVGKGRQKSEPVRREEVNGEEFVWSGMGWTAQRPGGAKRWGYQLRRGGVRRTEGHRYGETWRRERVVEQVEQVTS
jgi:hypothetical protein